MVSRPLLPLLPKVLLIWKSLPSPVTELKNPGAIAISEALPKLTKLKELIVFQDVIKKDGMLALLKSLTANCPDLELLDIRDNFLKEETIEEMAKLIKASKNLKALNISDCNIEEDENDSIIEALE